MFQTFKICLGKATLGSLHVEELFLIRDITIAAMTFGMSGVRNKLVFDSVTRVFAEVVTFTILKRAASRRGTVLFSTRYGGRVAEAGHPYTTDQFISYRVCLVKELK